MEILRLGHQSTMLLDSEVYVPGIGTFQRISINGNTSFPYLDIQLAWSAMGQLIFNVYRKPGELEKYLNTTKHHHKNLKAAVLSGVELQLALLTMVTADNEHLSMSDIYPDKHEALSTSGQLKLNKKMRLLRDILDDKY
jgi:hypothetical protein